MSATSAFGRVTSSFVAACVVVIAVPISTSDVHASTDRLRITFDNDAVAGSVLTDGAVITDVSGQTNHGVVMTAFDGSVLAAAAPTGIGAGFPGNCMAEPCPDAVVQVADSPSLDPLTADFEWGARVLMQTDEVADGENVIQKGLYAQVGGQWKLQVDKYMGAPSCVVAGRVPGQTRDRRVVVTASVGVADGLWHSVSCRRTAAAGVQIFIDGVLRGSASMPLVNLASDAPVTIGAKAVGGGDNDQYLGVLDDVYMTVLDGAAPVDNPPAVAPITFVGQSSTSGHLIAHVANIPTAVVPGDGLLLFFSGANNTTVRTPAGWVQVDALTNTNGLTRVWRRVAAAGDAGGQVKIVLGVQSKGAMTVVAYRGTSAVNPVASWARTMITTSNANRTTPVTSISSPSMVVSYWMHKDSSTSALVAPAGVTARAAGSQVGGGHVTVLTADSGTAVPAGSYGGLTAQAAAVGPFATTWTIVLAPA